MPVEVQSNALYEVKDFGIDKTKDGYAMHLSCPKATAFVLCFSKEDEPIDCGRLSFSEADLANLHNGGIINRENCRVQGVAAYTFNAMPSYSGFTVNPPERIQVWSMFRDSFGNIKLFTTNNTAECFVPLGYQYKITEEKNRAFLNIKIDPTHIGGYVDGALGYRIGHSEPIPIPKKWINKSFPLKPGVDVNVVPCKGQEHKFKQV